MAILLSCFDGGTADTYSRDTLEDVKTQNVTLSLPEPLLRQFRVYAAQRSRSMTALMTEAIRKMIGEDGEREARHKRMVERMRNAPDRGTHGKITWTRDEIWERTNWERK
jgi:hypothetical protein